MISSLREVRWARLWRPHNHKHWHFQDKTQDVFISDCKL